MRRATLPGEVRINGSADSLAARILDQQALRRAASGELAGIDRRIDDALRDDAMRSGGDDLAPLTEGGLAPLVEDPRSGIVAGHDRGDLPDARLAWF